MIYRTSDPAHNFRTLQLSYDSGYLPTRHSKLGRNNIENETQLYRLCNEVLFYIWDPIGVRTSAAARDEYDSYAKTVFRYLEEGQNAQKIADYLGEVRTTSIGLPSAREEDYEVAELLVAWRESIREGIA